MKAAAEQKTDVTIRFSAKLQAGKDEAIVALPKTAASKLPKKTMVEGTIEGFPFRAPSESGSLHISEALQKAAGASIDETVTVEITRFGDEPEVLVPADLRAALEAAPPAHALFEKVTPNARREWVRWIASAKQEETRQRRIEVGIDKLSKGMRRPCCFPGINFVTKGLVPPEETWISLPGSKSE